MSFKVEIIKGKSQILVLDDRTKEIIKIVYPQDIQIGTSNVSKDLSVIGDISARVGSFSQGMTGSLTRLVDGTTYLAGAGSVTITTSSNGQVIITGGGGGAGGAPYDAQYLTLAVDASLTNERTFAAGTGLSITDGGAGGRYIVSADSTVVFLTASQTLTNKVLTNPTINSPTITSPNFGSQNISTTGIGSFSSGISGSLTKLLDGTSYIINGSPGSLSITSQSNGSIVLSASGGGGSSSSGADREASFIVVGTTSSLPNERSLFAGPGLVLTDFGSGNDIEININNNILATITGSTFTQLSGSLQRTSSGLSYLAGAGAISVTSQSNGQIIISASAGNDAPISAQYLTLATDATLQNERVLTAGGGVTITDAGAGSTATLGINNNLIATITGSTFTQLSGSLQRTSAGLSYLVAASGITVVSSSAASTGQIVVGINNALIATITGSTFTQLSGSLQMINGTLPYLLSQGGITITTQSNGQIIISGSSGGAGGSGAPTTAQYLTLATDATLTAERVLTAGGGVTITDGGAGGNATLGINNGLIATITGSTFTQLSGSLQKTSAGLSYLVSGGTVTVTSQSNGQIIISGSGAGGLSTHFQINNASVFSGSGQFLYDTTNNRAVAGAQGFEISNPAGTFGTVLKSAAVAADRTITLPLLAANDTAVTEAFTQTLTNKTLTSPVINTPNFGANNITTTGTGTFTAGVVAGKVTLTSQDITTTPTINDAALGTGISTLSFSGAGPLILTGIAGGVDGRMLFILNNSGDTLTMNHEDAGSTAANRFTNCYSVNHIIQPGVSVVIIYFSSTGRWHPCISF